MVRCIVCSTNRLTVNQLYASRTLNEIVDARQPRCPPSYQQIKFPTQYFGKDDQEVLYQPTTNHSFMILNKLAYGNSVSNELNNPPRKANYRTAFIDGEILYGNSKFCADQLRTFTDGKLKDITKLSSSDESASGCSKGIHLYNLHYQCLSVNNTMIVIFCSIWKCTDK